MLSWIVNKLEWAIRPHPEERGKDAWFKEEARAERIINILRIIWMTLWIISLVPVMNIHPPSANMGNIGGGSLMLFLSIIYFWHLRKTVYKKWMKYVSVFFDVFMICSVLFVYHYDMGYSTSLKALPFTFLLLYIFTAALRFDVRYLVYTVFLVVVGYGSVLGYNLATQPVEFGTPLEVFTTPKISLLYQGYRFSFILATATLAYLIVLSIRRLVQQRQDEIKRRNVFERYFSPEIVDYLIQQPGDLIGREMNATIMMTDLRDFTATSERLGVGPSVELLNQVFEKLVAILFQHGGTLDKFLGDGMLAGFGVPETHGDDAQRAVQAAVEMVQAVDEIGGEHGLQLGVAIHSGTIYFGNVGSTQRLELTMIGDAVNTVSRMESLNKDFDTRIILSEGVRTQLNGDFQMHDLGEVKIRGKENEVKLFSVDALESNSL